MRKIYLLFIVAFVAVAGLNAQTTIIDENFDALAIGTGVASQVGAPWTTWSGATGGSEDPVVTDVVSSSVANSIHVVGGNDLVLNLGDKTAGRFQITFDMYITSGKVAYLNLLQDFDGQDSEWATQTFFNADGTTLTDAGGADNGAAFTFTHESWFNVNYIVDLNDDWATLYLDNNEIVSWKFSGGSYGDGTMLKLDAVNMYGWSDDNGVASNFYVDNVQVIEQPAMDGPTGLTVSIVNDNTAALSWTAPAITADEYAIIRNDVAITTTTSLTFDNDGLYPGNYDYAVRAHYFGLGYSALSNVASAFIAGGVDRDLVLLEINTGTWCGYCPGAAMGADDMEAQGYDCAIIEYHNGDSYANDDCIAREVYYNVTGFPTSTVDGLAGFSGGSATESLFPSYESMYNMRKDIPSVHLVDLQLTQIDATNFEATVVVEESMGFFGSGLVLRSAFIESHIAESWGGLSEVNFVCHKMYPNAAGTSLDFSSTNTITTTFNINTQTSVLDNSEFVVFIQHDPSKEVVQTARFHFSTFGIGESTSDNYVNVYPNPNNGQFILDISSSKTKSFDVTIMNVTGQTVENFIINDVNIVSKSIDLSSYDAGSYFIRINDGESTVVKSVIIK